ncbi:MAG: cytochrome b/b6 domain-containing protein [Archaeoglobaceae archaeon]
MTSLKRFSAPQKVVHFLISFSILMLLITGLPVTFFESLGWVVAGLGGSEVTMLLHRFFALLLLASIVFFGIYFILERLTGKKGSKLISLGLISGSVKDILWSINLRKERPKFDKYDWVMVADIIGIPILVVIIGISGIFMWFPHWFFSDNPALFFTFRTIHAFFAIFFLLFVFAHAGTLHLTPGNFPMNMTIFNGLISRKKAESEHPLWVEKAEKVEAEPTEHKFNPIGYLAYAIAIIALILIVYTTYIMVGEGFAGLRVVGDNILVAIGLNLGMLVVIIFTVATVIGGITGVAQRTKT